MTQILVIAKEPLPGRVKTRLCPPCTGEQAARLAAAALEDTLRTVAATRAPYRVLALQGLPGPWLPPGFTVIPQRGRGLDERLAAAFTDAHRLHPVPTVLVGMDTPQLTPSLLHAASDALTWHDAVYGPAEDGGFWLLGLRRPDPALLLGVPMSQPGTGAAQLGRLRQAGLTTAFLPELRDVDTFADACHVAARAPATRFAATLAAVRGSMAAGHAGEGDAGAESRPAGPPDPRAVLTPQKPQAMTVRDAAVSAGP
ncbi:TIGR04282 family arsenosugar biosynthesis glycosyltransferase [Sphaerisporangium corydalis]|uniref:TIGR04282 family arsenosugar biosynthesis glycosyltransferase n=1 Tax=Sphaerisporangium corydalis TaxID=1441875 RepID=A0ABV9EFQ4_9ACTN|nr:TIGR04282 family arsenosugar biosynthesis glycosyltransferase [Sphaerisporangium corydalis]